MKILIPVLLALSAPALSCDWEVSRKTDPMTDVVTCAVSSASAKVAFYRYGTDRPNIIVGSAYSRPMVELRVDDLPAVNMGYNAHERGKALDVLLPQLETGKRLRVRYSDYPETQVGDAPICDLPKLLASCGP